jgi:transposase-like protein
MKELTGRSLMKSPGKPSLRRDVERAFWRRIAEGLSSEDAALAVGVSQAAGSRWFRERGGMPTFMLDEVSCRYLCFEEREEIALLGAQGAGVREIARQLDRSPSTISRGAAAQRGDPWRQARVPGFGGAVEGRADGSPAEDREARRQRGSARVRATAALR